MFETIELLNQIKAMNPGSEITYDSEKRVYILKAETKEISIPDECISYESHIYTADFEKKVCRIEIKS